VGKNPTDRGKKGCKESVLVDGDGGPLGAVIAAANVNDHLLLRETIAAIVIERPEPTPEAPQHLCLDAGYDNATSRAVASAQREQREEVPDSLWELMRAAEAAARAAGRTLLVLDTATGGDAERLYARLGWQRCGVIPGYALLPHGGLCGTTLFYRELTGTEADAEPS
jgi:hypothetical protein